MLNQSFTAENFRKIFDYENRKGNYLEGLFFPEIEQITKEIKINASAIRSLNKNKISIPTKDYEQTELILKEKQADLKEKKEKLLSTELESISDKITSGKYRFKIKLVNTKLSPKTYKIEKDACGYFALKQLQSNLSRLYRVQQSNRHNIICQLKNVLNDRFPKWIFRTDIKSFYENIPSHKILETISSQHLLTSSSKKLIRQILTEYRKFASHDNGVPRGIGISAYLAELYMREFDRYIKYHSEIVFYARYVDDIVVVISPKPNSDPQLLIDGFVDKLNKLGLSLNPQKTKTIQLLTPINTSLEYLGYTFRFGTSEVSLTLSKKRLEKYKNRMNLSFNAYKSKSRYNEKKARKLLIKRIRFLTGNTRLLNNKKNALVGVYFSNSLITNIDCMKILDRHLTSEIGKVAIPELKQRLEKYSFESGFKERRFCKFSTSDLARIVKVWKNVT